MPRGRGVGNWLVDRVDRRLWPLVVTIPFVVLGIAYIFWWGPVVQHKAHLWLVPADLDTTYVSATELAFGHLGAIWKPGNRSVNGLPGIYPGLMIVLAPLGALATTFRTTLLVATPHAGALVQRRFFIHDGLVSVPPAWFISHGSHFAIQPQWTQFVVPFTLLLACLPLYSCDALAERLGVTRRRRMLLVVVEAILLWNVVRWGHPEDAIALALAIYAFVFALDRRFAGAGWLMGAAVCFQPFVLLMVPVLLVMAGRPAAIGTAVRSVVPMIVLMVGPLIGAFHSTFQELTKQPNYPNADHRTPWTTFAAHVSGHGRTYAVTAGPGNLISVILACGLAAWVRRWRTRPELLVFSCALALALWPYTEAVMVAYYVWPALALGVVVAAKARTPRFVFAGAFAVLTTIVAQWQLAWLPWWLLVLGGLTIVLVAAASPAPVDAEVPIETGRLRVWLAYHFHTQPVRIPRLAVATARGEIAASSGPNRSGASKKGNARPRGHNTAPSSPKASAVRKRNKQRRARKKR